MSEVVNQNKLAEHHRAQKRPDKSFAQPQAALVGGREPELKFGATDRNDVAVVEQCRLNRFAVNHNQGVLRRHEPEALPPAEFQRQVLIPSAIVIQLQAISVGTTNAERKTADNRLAAHLSPCENVEFNHQKIRRGTWI